MKLVPRLLRRGDGAVPQLVAPLCAPGGGVRRSERRRTPCDEFGLAVCAVRRNGFRRGLSVGERRPMKKGRSDHVS